jgi:cell division transport system permease protein
VLSLSVAFVCLAAALLIVTNIALVRDRWSKAGRATVYLREGVEEAAIEDLARALEATPGVKKVRHVTSLEARREVVFDENDKSLAALPPSAFPASLEVGFSSDVDDKELAAMTIKLRALPAVETVETYQRWTERLSALLGGGVTASACLAFIVLCAVMSVITSTTRLLLHRRRVEVEVLRLVGATDAFVRRPFVVEAAMQGAAGAATAIAIVGVLFLMVSGRFDHELASLLGVAPSFLPWPLALGMVALGGALGAGTALLSLRKMAEAG